MSWQGKNRQILCFGSRCLFQNNCNMQMRLLPTRSLFFDQKNKFEISHLMAQRRKAESRICLKHRLRKGEVTHEKWRGDTGGVGGPLQVLKKGDSKLKVFGKGWGGFIRRPSVVHEGLWGGPWGVKGWPMRGSRWAMRCQGLHWGYMYTSFPLAFFS